MLKRYGLVSSGVVCLFALIAACSSTDKAEILGPGSNGGAGGAGGGSNRAGAGGKAGSSSDAGEAGAPDTDELAPTVSITSPIAARDPNKDEVLTGADIKVLCSAVGSSAAGASPVQASTVKIQMLGADGVQIGADGKVSSTDNSNEYTATFILTDVPAGAVSFRCSASDQSSAPRSATGSVRTFVDHGPTVTLKSPAPGSAHPLSPALLFKFTVAPVALADNDESEEVTSVSLRVNGVTIDGVPAHELPGKAGEYEISIDLNDTSVFTPVPSGSVPVRIVATNKRGTTRTSDSAFNVDSLGPVIKIVSPAVPNQFIGGKVTLSFTVTDSPAGVDPATVQVVLNGTPFTFDPKNGWVNPMPNSFLYTFDTKNFGNNKVQLNVNFRAKDLAGNASDGEAIIYYLDNTPPVIDLAPPALQEVRRVNETTRQCSTSFLPLGEAPRDLDTIVDLVRFRALIWDFGNVANGQDAFYFSDVDNSNSNTVPHLYFQTDPTKPLLKFSDPTKQGQVCDTIADESLPLATLVPLLPTGNAVYNSTAPIADGVCVAGNDSPAQAPFLCAGTSDLRRVIQRETTLAATSVPAVYVIPSDALQCTGTQLQITNIAPKDGWICVAVSATDKTGNRAVSAPLRLCLDSAEYPGSPPCAVSSTAPPSCVSDCVAPAHFTPGYIARP